MAYSSKRLALYTISAIAIAVVVGLLTFAVVSALN